MSRVPTRQYADPVDLIWLETARRIGLRVARSGEVYASTDGRQALTIGEAPTLDPDDCMAQMVFHELCHSLIEGPEAFERPDWGLDNASDRDLDREHACLRLQAHLAQRFGLRGFLAPTTDHRAYFDELPAAPLEDRRNPVVALAILGLRRVPHPPWGPHLEEALASTAEIARVATRYAARPGGREAPPLWQDVAPPLGRHPLGFSLHVNGGRHCRDCAWWENGSCRNDSDTPCPGESPACERWEPALDCLTCGACCRAAYHSVEIEEDDPVVTRHPERIINRGSYLELERRGDACGALIGSLEDGFHCEIYDARPRTCREFERGGEHCLTARRRVGLSF